MIKQLIVVITFLISGMTYGQNQYGDNITKQGNELCKAMVTQDYETLAKYTYPRIVEMMGGKKQMIATVAGGMQQLKSQGIQFKEVSIGEPEKIYTAGKEIHCLVPQTIISDVQGTEDKRTTYLLAISKNKGKRWYFVDATNLDNTNVKNLLPEFNDDMKLPKKQ